MGESKLMMMQPDIVVIEAGGDVEKKSPPILNDSHIKCCCCIPVKCAIIIVAILELLDLIQIIYVFPFGAKIINNEYMIPGVGRPPFPWFGYLYNITFILILAPGIYLLVKFI